MRAKGTVGEGGYWCGCLEPHQGRSQVEGEGIIFLLCFFHLVPTYPEGADQR